jgi:4-hydroxybenzoate polyprenyltransferase
MFLFLKKPIFKADKWWNCQIALMLGAVYASLTLKDTLPEIGPLIKNIFFFLISSIGIAAFGQMFNDLHDRIQDERTGASNMMLGKKPERIILMFFSVLIMAWFPWIWLPHVNAIWWILLAEYLLFILYSQPPIRLKSRDILGAFVDSSYAYVNSTLVGTLLFSSMTNGNLPVVYLPLLIAWTFTMGFRQILLHQLVDANRDLADGIQTFVVKYGACRTFRLLFYVVIPGEFILFFVFLIFLGMKAFYIPLFFVAFMIYIYFRERKKWIWRTKNLLRLPKITLATLFTDQALDHFMLGWFPMLMLLPLCLRQPWYLVVAALHYFFFENGPKRVINYDILPRLKKPLIKFLN